MKINTDRGLQTILLHNTHNHPEDAHNTPIFSSSTFTFPSAEVGMGRFQSKDKQKIYTRWNNPSALPAEQLITALETFGLKDNQAQPLQAKALLHSSGQAAMTTLFMSLLKQGDAVLSHHSLYGGTYELLHTILAPLGVQPIIIDFDDIDNIAQILEKQPNIRLIHIETPANPTLKCVDIAAVAAVAKRYGIKVSVDNTFATPLLQQPFQYGVDFIFHSTTKFLNGHGTAVGGILIGRDIDFMQTVAWKYYALLGGCPSPFDAFLLETGLKTLPLRMPIHTANAAQLAHFLDQHPAVEKVNYPGLSTHPHYYLAQRQMKAPGSILSFELKGGITAGKDFINRLQLCTRAVSVGTLDSLVCHPASMTHYGLSQAERIKYDITDGLIRVSVGIENIADIIQDMEQAIGA